MSATRSSPRRGRAALPVFVLALSCLAPEALGQVSTSGSFALSQSTVNSGGASAVSPSFVLDGSAAQKGTVGEASSPSLLLQSGFWNGLSTLEVLQVAGAGSGRGTATGSGVSCTLDAGVPSGDCLERVTDGTMLELVAAPFIGSRFDDWSGCDAVTTSTLPGDTCQLAVVESRTATAGFTRLGSVGGRVWRDLDGDGVPDAGEPGVDGVTLNLEDGGGFSVSATTAAGGLYDFADVPPGSYSVSVAPATLPPGVFPSFDSDGATTPHTAAIDVFDGQGVGDVDFGYQPLADLAITKTASSEPLPRDGLLTYTITVQNLGPAAATGVVVADVLPQGLTLVASAGCGEDPAGAPTCTLGELQPGGVAGFTLEVETDPSSEVANSASVAAAEADPDDRNNSATVVTGPMPPVPIPAARPAGLALLGLLLAMIGAWLVRGRPY